MSASWSVCEILHTVRVNLALADRRRAKNPGEQPCGDRPSRERVAAVMGRRSQLLPYLFPFLTLRRRGGEFRRIARGHQDAGQAAVGSVAKRLGHAAYRGC